MAAFKGFPHAVLQVGGCGTVGSQMMNAPEMILVAPFRIELPAANGADTKITPFMRSPFVDGGVKGAFEDLSAFVARDRSLRGPAALGPTPVAIHQWGRRRFVDATYVAR